jgi:hypothetical protein
VKYFHLSPVENAEKIRRDGINGGPEGMIFAFTDMIAANAIARHQVFTKRYVVFEIEKSAVGRTSRDRVAEFGATFQRIIHKKHIATEHLKFVGELDTIYGPTELDYQRYAKCGLPREFVDRENEIIKWADSQFVNGQLSQEVMDECNRRLAQNLAKFQPADEHAAQSKGR